MFVQLNQIKLTCLHFIEIIYYLIRYFVVRMARKIIRSALTFRERLQNEQNIGNIGRGIVFNLVDKGPEVTP